MADSDDPRVEFGLSCPVHGKFYICEDSPTRFVGCCDIDPCTAAANGECPSSALFPASFSSASGVIFVAQGCAAPFNNSIWYTCNNAIPPFLGCCKNNPCNNGCDAGNLLPATLSDDPKNASQFMLPSTTTTSSSSSIPSSSLSLNPSPTTTSTGAPQSSNSSRIGIIVGTSLAGVVVLILVITAYLWLKRREQNRLDNKSERDLGYDYGSPKDAEQSEQFFQRSMFTTSPTYFSPSPIAKSPFSPTYSDQSPHDPQRVSQLSELEGSSVIPRVQPNLVYPYHDTDGRKL